MMHKVNAESLLADLAAFPLSFRYDGVLCRGLSAGFFEVSRETVTEEKQVRHTVVLTHNASGAKLTLTVCDYPGYNACDWVVWMENPTEVATGVFSDVMAIDMDFAGAHPVMQGMAGDCGRDMYKPYAHDLCTDGAFVRESVSGRPTHGVFPYFNLAFGTGGCFVALGWPGCWRVDARAETPTEGSAEGTVTHVTGGQQTLATTLLPGESLRTPLVALLGYEGRDEEAATNLWRRWFIDCNMRHVDGRPMPPLFLAFTLSQGWTSRRMVDVIRTYAAHGVPLDCYWMDAGWYTDAEGKPVEWPHTGSLRIDEERFPDHFVDVTNAVEETGGISLLWFEPEVVRQDKETFLAATPDFRAEWMLGVAFPDTWLEGQLLDLGNPACRAWLLGRILPILREARIAVYRQDFNVDPAPVWKLHDTEGRRGLTENRYAVGYLALWDAIIAAFPRIWMDSCASGGGRNDLETMRRGIPAQSSDYWDGRDDGYDERQATMMSFVRWIPYTKYWMYGGEAQGSFTYRARSCYGQMLPLQVDTGDPDTPWDEVRRLREEWGYVTTFHYADFYPLTEWNNDTDRWRGFEYFDPARDAGVAQLFRPAFSAEETQVIRLRGLAPDRTYRISDTDGTFSVEASGRALCGKGLAVTLDHPLYAMVLRIDAV